MGKKNVLSVFDIVLLVVVVLLVLSLYFNMFVAIKMVKCSFFEDRAILYFGYDRMDLYEEYCVKADKCNHSLVFRILNFFGSKPLKSFCGWTK